MCNIAVDCHTMKDVGCSRGNDAVNGDDEMLSPQMLERVSVAYRRGYEDGYNSTNRGALVRPEYIKPFAAGDYKDGLLAGWNDQFWAGMRMGPGGMSTAAMRELRAKELVEFEARIELLAVAA